MVQRKFCKTLARIESRPKGQIIYEPAWRRGKTYAPLSLGKHSVSGAENISITIQILPISGQRG